MKPKPKQLAYRNVVPDPMIMLERGNRSYNYAKTWQPILSTHHNHNHKYIVKIMHLSHGS